MPLLACNVRRRAYDRLILLSPGLEVVMRRFMFSASALAAMLLSFSPPGEAGDKSDAKRVIPRETYKVLTARSANLIEETAKADGKNAVGKIIVEAAILRAYTVSVKDFNLDDIAMGNAALVALSAAQIKDLKSLTILLDSQKNIGTTTQKIDQQLKKFLIVLRDIIIANLRGKKRLLN